MTQKVAVYIKMFHTSSGLREVSQILSQINILCTRQAKRSK